MSGGNDRCPSCDSDKMVLVESKPEGVKVLRCESCGESVTMDKSGRRLLMEVPSARESGTLLLG